MEGDKEATSRRILRRKQANYVQRDVDGVVGRVSLMKINRSIRYLAFVFVLLFLVLSADLVYWQAIMASTIVANLHNGRRCLSQNAPQRGRIFDRNGVLLAQSLPDKSAICGFVRHYSEPSLAGLLGYYVPGYGMLDGVEKQYSAILDGAESQTELETIENQLLHRSMVGNDIYLTIDIRIQRVVSRYFTHYHPQSDPLYKQPFFRQQAFASSRGAVVVSDPHTGEILAMVSLPGYDPNRMAQTLAHGDMTYFNRVNTNKDQPLLMRPLKALYVPGSIFKTLTLMAALDTGTTTLEHPWFQREAMGPLIYGGRQIIGDNLAYGEYTFHFPITTAYAYANSDNIVFAQLGVNTGRDLWLDYAHRLTIDRPSTFDLPVAMSSVQNSDNQPLSTLQLASGAFGQGVDNVTPFEMSLMDNAVANNGILMRPRLLLKIVDAQHQLVLASSPQQLNVVTSKETAYQMRWAMNGVTTCGSAWRVNAAFGPPVSIIGKTGTAEVGAGWNAHSWMITQAPFWLDDPDQMPAVTIVAMRENAGEGAYAVGPAIWQMYRDIFHKGYIKTRIPVANNPNLFCPAQNLWQRR